MTTAEFNKKYEEYLEEGHYGLDIFIPSVIEYLDKEVFPGLIKIPGFKYEQIKLKFNTCRFYTNLFNCTNNFIGKTISDKVEEKIDNFVRVYDEVQKELIRISENGN